MARLTAEVPRETLGRPTPCDDFDVRDLLGHLIGTAHRGLATARRLPTRGIPHVVTEIPDAELASTYTHLTAQIHVAWSSLEADDDLVAPWGPCTAVEAARGFTVETITHGWDLAVATGQPAEAPNGIAERCLAFAAEAIPDRLRGVMYDQPVVGAVNSSPTEQLANLLGHRRNRR
ncbi:TIGR03086 family protein [Mangrovihabitans endophyticus]|uniref:TIGR03086 family protein n=1 Tax=Mangrovihabitans endophyticus TaxID=1751298 RepID=A0A8J3C567_9ACTN|nr:TIGR03086 family protein [Mangrovihabitans endophyticus]